MEMCLNILKLTLEIQSQYRRTEIMPVLKLFIFCKDFALYCEVGLGSFYNADTLQTHLHPHAAQRNGRHIRLDLCVYIGNVERNIENVGGNVEMFFQRYRLFIILIIGVLHSTAK